MPQQKITLQQIKAAFGLSRLPFAKEGLDIFEHDRFDSALESLTYLAQRAGIGSLTAPPGCGKSVLLGTFLESLSKTAYRTVYLAHTTCGVIDVYRQILQALDIQPAYRKADLYRQLQERLLVLSRQKRIRTVVAIDEAHKLTTGFLEEIRLFTNFECDSRDEVALVLSGQPQLESNLRLAVNEPLAQRIIIRTKLGPFSREEMVDYVSHRLSTAGRSAPLFTECGLEALHKASRGIPRLIDHIAERSIYAAIKKKCKQIDAQIISSLAIESEF
jgi:type II secretory pathway predicted ATPase ExeA